MRFVFTLIIFIGLAFSVTAKDSDPAFYPVNSISAAMKKDAWAVCRDYRHEFELTSFGKAIEKVHLVVTILNENADSYGQLMIAYDKSKKVKLITGKFYNGLGLPINKLKDTDIQDVNYTSAGSIYDDYRLKLTKIKGIGYPYTVEYNYEIEHDGMIHYPDFQPIDAYRISFEKSSFQVTYPENYQIRVREVNIRQGCKE